MKVSYQKALIMALITVLVLFCPACLDLFGKLDAIEGSGKVITVAREVSSFRGVVLATAGKLYIEYGDREELRIEAEDNLIDYLDVAVVEGTLKIQNRRDYSLRPSKPLRYFVKVRNLDFLGISSSGDIYAPDIKTNELKISSSSSGDIIAGNVAVSGLIARLCSSGDVILKEITADILDVEIASSGDFAAAGAEVRSVKANISSSGEIQIGVLRAEQLSAHISSSGDIRIEDGRALKQNIEISSSGNYKARELSSSEADIRISSSGDAYVNVSEYLRASLSSSGSVFYRGDPSIVAKERSSGKVRKSD